jgi:hypothetical protein
LLSFRKYLQLACWLFASLFMFTSGRLHAKKATVLTFFTNINSCDVRMWQLKLFLNLIELSFFAWLNPMHFRWFNYCIFFATVKNELVRVAKSVVASIATTQNGWDSS